jgi:phosphatidate cytidylyltransferase
MAGGNDLGGVVAATTPRKSDLRVRALSAIVMVAVAGAAVWLGGWPWTAFVVLVALGVFREWRGIVVGFVRSTPGLGLWNAAGLVYIGAAAATLISLRETRLLSEVLVVLVLAVIATDIGAYFAGRTIGGPKIAPKISPSKTWAGLGGGIVGATLAVLVFAWRRSGWQWGAREWLELAPQCLLAGAVCAVVAQAGDFFESWMKRRAGVKDSGRLLPGHGGLFDRVDGLLAVSFLLGIYIIALRAMEPL